MSSSSRSGRSESSKKTNISSVEIKNMFDLFGWDPLSIEVVIVELCTIHSEEDPNALERKIRRIYNKHEFSPQKPSSRKRVKKEVRTGQLVRAEVEDALLIYDRKQIDELIDYLLSISAHQHLTREQVEDELQTVYDIIRPTASRSPSSSRNRRKSKDAKGSRVKSTISTDDVNEGLEFFNYALGPQLAENMVNYFNNKYPNLSPQTIRKQLKQYDLTGSDYTKPSTPQKSPPTPPRRGDFYLPSDFSPSTYGAVAESYTEFLKKKRAKHLPDYVSPPTPRSTRRLPSPRQPSPRRLSFTSPERPESSRYSPSHKSTRR